MAGSAVPPGRRLESTLRWLDDRVRRVEHLRDAPAVDIEVQPAKAAAAFTVIFPLEGMLIAADSFDFKAPRNLRVRQFDMTMKLPAISDSLFQFVVNGQVQVELPFPATEASSTRGGLLVSLPVGSISFFRCIIPGVSGADFQATAWVEAA